LATFLASKQLDDRIEAIPDAQAERKTEDEPFRPNIILIITDDQDIELGKSCRLPVLNI